MNHYINYVFRRLKQEGDIIRGVFDAYDNNVWCEFEYNIKTKEYDISNNNVPIENIVPLPLFWLDYQLEKDGKLNETEGKICY